MKPSPFIVLTADQRRSRRQPDRVPEALAVLNDLPGMALAFERTTGDEVQGLVRSASSVVEAVMRLSRLGDWRIGLGLGEVDQPLPGTTREARGPAYLLAREAVERSRSVAAELRLLGPDVTAGAYDRVQAAETVLWLLRTVWGRRTPQGWEVAQMLEHANTAADVAAELGISPSAVSQRSARAHIVEDRRGRELAISMLVDLGLEP
ncbi:transposase [Aestuariimicrobium ganziense]|uniref:transposase n=1 Tax=Aestuariimicrobium ganziense TaxID=2773677 RepID=UPI0019415A57|nr:transposase [Aestuariimicrobium ganziense]